MNTPPRDRLAHALRLAACLLMLAAAAAAQHGRVLGRPLVAPPPAIGSATPSTFSTPSTPSPVPRSPVPVKPCAATLVLLLAAVVPLVTKSRRWRTVQLALDVGVLGLWSGSFLSTARLLGWAGSGLRGSAADWATALLLLSMAFLYPLFGRPSHYCLHACPFGAAQELAGRIPARKRTLPPRLVRALTAFRRGLWAALMLAAWCGAWTRWTGWELFGAFAWRAVPPLLLALAAAFLVLAVFTPRPYCRFVCPTGTLLKLAEANQPETNKP